MLPQCAPQPPGTMQHQQALDCRASPAWKPNPLANLLCDLDRVPNLSGLQLPQMEGEDK